MTFISFIVDSFIIFSWCIMGLKMSKINWCSFCPLSIGTASKIYTQNKLFFRNQQMALFKVESDWYQAGDGGHDVINSFEFPCNSMKNPISIWNYANKILRTIKKIQLNLTWFIFQIFCRNSLTLVYADCLLSILGWTASPTGVTECRV